MPLFLYIIIAIFVCIGAIISLIFMERTSEPVYRNAQETDFEEIVQIALFIGALWIITLPLIIIIIIVLLIYSGLISFCEYLYNILGK